MCYGLTTQNSGLLTGKNVPNKFQMNPLSFFLHGHLHFSLFPLWVDMLLECLFLLFRRISGLFPQLEPFLSGRTSLYFRGPCSEERSALWTHTL
ncbi:hypothetical protein GALMADRAFT_698220 [Galerina marginata CBS 339.88]|uniref:Uncharacterized protein n=1 Tax=Galerina marginata (strain CBS 339.88) TaxID=685588 RepID=A0A067TLL2_GALM3|nr:hypothetical protein GALMADRAFT_698220 [Galerina marginata CBS 339.88]